MRQIVLDTETTGLSVEDDHRVIEIGCLELQGRRRTEHQFHVFLNPDREIDAGAVAVHGISNEKLRDAPRFADVVESFIEFIRGAELVIHNASFDVGFLDRELERLGPAWGRLGDYCTVLDTLKLARDLHPGQRNSLDALCKRYEVDNGHRSFHGALLDADLLTEVYLAMTGGQTALVLLHTNAAGPGQGADAWAPAAVRPRPVLRVVLPTDEEKTAHRARLQVINDASGGKCLWLAAPGPD